MKTLYITTILLIIFMGWGVYVANQYRIPEGVLDDSPLPSVSSTALPVTPTPLVTPTPTLTPTPTPIKTPVPSGVVTPTPSPIPSIIPTMTPTPTPTPVPTPPPSSCGSGGSCTAAQVATHNTAGNCWVYLSSNSKVYNITGYIASGSHPAGSSIIVQACGKDLYPYFITGAIGGHRHTNYALNTILSAYYIGPLQ